MKKAIIIGIGSTGVDIIVKLRDRINWHLGDYKKCKWLDVFAMETNEEHAKNHLKQDEYISLTIDKPDMDNVNDSKSDVYKEMKLADWYRGLAPNQNQLLQGAGGYRSVGRLAFLMGKKQGLIVNRIGEKLGDLVRLNIAKEIANYGLDPMGDKPTWTISNNINIYVCGTTCGGTFSGCAIDLGYLLRLITQNMTPTPETSCFAILPDADWTGNNRTQLLTNALGFLSDLNYYSAGAPRYKGILMHKNNLMQEYRGASGQRGAAVRPFDTMYLASPVSYTSVRNNSQVKRDYEELKEVIAEFIFHHIFSDSSDSNLAVQNTAIDQIDQRTADIKSHSEGTDGKNNPLWFMSIGLGGIEYSLPKVVNACSLNLLEAFANSWVANKYIIPHRAGETTIARKDLIDSFTDLVPCKLFETLRLDKESGTALDNRVSRISNADTPTDTIKKVDSAFSGRLIPETTVESPLPSGLFTREINSNLREFLDGKAASRCLTKFLNNHLTSLEYGPEYVIDALSDLQNFVDYWKSKTIESMMKKEDDWVRYDLTLAAGSGAGSIQKGVNTSNNLLYSISARIESYKKDPFLWFPFIGMSLPVRNREVEGFNRQLMIYTSSKMRNACEQPMRTIYEYLSELLSRCIMRLKNFKTIVVDGGMTWIRDEIEEAKKKSTVKGIEDLYDYEKVVDLQLGSLGEALKEKFGTNSGERNIKSAINLIMEGFKSPKNIHNNQVLPNLSEDMIMSYFVEDKTSSCFDEISDNKLDEEWQNTYLYAARNVIKDSLSRKHDVLGRFWLTYDNPDQRERVIQDLVNVSQPLIAANYSELWKRVYAIFPKGKGKNADVRGANFKDNLEIYLTGADSSGKEFRFESDKARAVTLMSIEGAFPLRAIAEIDAYADEYISHRARPQVPKTYQARLDIPFGPKIVMGYPESDLIECKSKIVLLALFGLLNKPSGIMSNEDWDEFIFSGSSGIKYSLPRNISECSIMLSDKKEENHDLGVNNVYTEISEELKDLLTVHNSRNFVTLYEKASEYAGRIEKCEAFFKEWFSEVGKNQESHAQFIKIIAWARKNYPLYDDYLKKRENHIIAYMGARHYYKQDEIVRARDYPKNLEKRAKQEGFYFPISGSYSGFRDSNALYDYWFGEGKEVNQWSGGENEVKYLEETEIPNDPTWQNSIKEGSGPINISGSADSSEDTWDSFQN